VQLEIAGANVDWPEGARGLLEGTLTLRGTQAGPVLAGDLLLADGAYRGDPRTLVTPKAATLGGGEEGPTLLSGLGLDLRLRTEPDVRVDNPFGTFAFSVDVTARGSAAAPRLTGQVALQPNGFVYWSGRKFTLERATLDWKGASGLMPFVQARATTRVSSYDEFADFSGPLATADARLVSNPPLGSNEITSLLVTGSTTSGRPTLAPWASPPPAQQPRPPRGLGAVPRPGR
jgi:autotransporter translocation and assembly factor TamB